MSKVINVRFIAGTSILSKISVIAIAPGLTLPLSLRVGIIYRAIDLYHGSLGFFHGTKKVGQPLLPSDF